MPFDHNDHYHRLLLRQLPRRGGAALDVGCGTGRFARRLARLGMAVDGVDPSEEVIAEARACSPQGGEGPAPRYRCADITEIELPSGHYDVITCLASLHHMPFGTVSVLSDALAPGGILLVLGCYEERTWRDRAWALAAAPTNAAIRLGVAVRERLSPAFAARARARVRPPVAAPGLPLDRIRREAATLLPGCAVRRLLFWRYLLVFRAGAERPGVS